MPDQNFRRGAGKSRRVVMLCQPEPSIAERVGVFGQRYGFGNRPSRICRACDRRLVKNIEDKICHEQIITKIDLACQPVSN